MSPVVVRPGSAVVPAGGTYTPPQSGPSFVTGVAASGRYLTDQDGNPILVTGDAVWGILGRGGQWSSGDWQGEMDTYVTTRSGQGYNAFIVVALDDSANAGPNDNGNTWDGVSPWSGGTIGVLNNTYWARLDYLMSAAAAAGMTVFLDPIYGAFGKQPALLDMSDSDATVYGVALGGRYKTYPNLVWHIGGDYDGQNAGWDTAMANFRTGATGAGDTHLWTIQNVQESSSRKGSGNENMAWGLAHAQFSQVYTYVETYWMMEHAWAEASPIPVILPETLYLFSGNDRVVREMIWWAHTSGAKGELNGTGDAGGGNGCWAWASGSPGYLTSQTFQATVKPGIAAFIRGLDGWHLMAPDTASTLVTAGRGTHRSAPAYDGSAEYTSATSNYVTCCYVADGSLALIYMPAATTITINESVMAAGYTASWVDPLTCARTAATPGTTYNSTAKGNNSAGNPDWALVLEGP